MDKNKIERRISRGAGRWHAARLEPVVKRLGSKKRKKPKQKETKGKK